MTETAKLVLPSDSQPATEHTAEATAPPAPVIRPEMARLLELTQASGAATTAKEINAQLDRVLRDYEELTALYAENNRRIDSELDEIRQSGGLLSGRVHQLGADLQQQGSSLAARATGVEERLEAVRGQAHAALADSEQRWESRLASSNARIAAELAQLDAGIGSLEALFRAQEQIVAEQRARLDQFDIACQLLDTATRGNKSRIEAVREQTERQHAIVEARIDGLGALQREHYAEFQDLRRLVGVLHSETGRLDAEIGTLAAALTTHRGETRARFKWTHLAITALFLLTVLGFALVKWLPAFAPAGTEAAVTQNQSRISEVDAQVAALAARMTAQQESDAQQQASIDRVGGRIGSLEKSLADLRSAVRKLRLQGVGGGVLHDAQWLRQQNPGAYTVQLVTSPSQGDMARFIDRNMAHLALDSLAYSVSEGAGGERYNLFFGVFPTLAQARAAIAALPAELQVNQPWVRPMRSVQESLR
ncbi:SPOR domain-containing protein [Accumulibacter sp.]|uniref:SPOR domain-containing protein n=1 Tax=Accumulibacter sp. TaxID=2053492 RepID=UPI001598B54E|nr:MAG: SPOR domain-containing protein [Candidatus Accumulibacter similis]